jgi:hypothetical protein
VPGLDGKRPPPAAEYANTFALACVSGSLIDFSSAATVARSSNRLVACRDGAGLIRVHRTQEQPSIARYRCCYKFRLRLKNTCLLHAPYIVVWNLRCRASGGIGAPVCAFIASKGARSTIISPALSSAQSLSERHSALAGGGLYPGQSQSAASKFDRGIPRTPPLSSNPDRLLKNLKRS